MKVIIVVNVEQVKTWVQLLASDLCQKLMRVHVLLYFLTKKGKFTDEDLIFSVIAD